MSLEKHTPIRARGIPYRGSAYNVSCGQHKPVCLSHSRSDPTWSIQGPKLGEHSYKQVSWMKWRLHLGGISPQWFQLKLYRLDWSLWASELVLAVQQALSFQGAHCNRARDMLVREGRQQLEGVRGCCRCQLPA